MPYFEVEVRQQRSGVMYVEAVDKDDAYDIAQEAVWCIDMDEDETELDLFEVELERIRDYETIMMSDGTDVKAQELKSQK